MRYLEGPWCSNLAGLSLFSAISQSNFPAKIRKGLSFYQAAVEHWVKAFCRHCSSGELTEPFLSGNSALTNGETDNRLDDKEHVLFVIRLLLDQQGNVLSGTLISEQGESKESFRSLEQIPDVIKHLLTPREN
ncbi:MAG: hypothetical protein ACE5Q6_12645 [Dehalococcoidia bacterium]